MPNEMTPLEAAEKLEWIAKIAETDAYICTQDSVPFLKQTASLLRAIAAGKYKRVVHAHIVGRGWDLHCSNCGASADIGNDYCPDCGARMDGKDDGHE